MRLAVFAAKLLRFTARWVGTYFESRRYEPSLVPHLSLETTNVCNSDCVFCANSVMKRKRGPMKMEHFTRAVDDFAALGGTQMDINVTIGDPLLDPYLLERARYVRRYPKITGLGFVTTLQWLHRFDLGPRLPEGQRRIGPRSREAGQGARVFRGRLAGRGDAPQVSEAQTPVPEGLFALSDALQGPHRVFQRQGRSLPVP